MEMDEWGQVPYCVYLGLLVCLIMAERPLLSLWLGVIVGTAAWFWFVQAVLIGRFCPWCMTAHGIGLSVAGLGLWRRAMAEDPDSVWRNAGTSALAAMLGLGLLQFYGPVPATYRMDDFKDLSASQASGIYARGDGRKAVFADGRRSYGVAALPHLGRADAKCVMVEYVDYSCPSCRVMGGFLDALMAKHPADICLVILPVPLERACNFTLGEKDAEFPGSCKLAKLALALWRTKPNEFAGFHRALLDGASAEEASARILDLMPPSELFAALKDPWIDELIQANVNDCAAFSRSSKKLPKLLITGLSILHGLPSGAADFIRVMEQELGL
ncbi:MAG: thioredoxin domain-containing protein [Verrucomicrobia bacterium]|nr:thioredoxin domain-containing protein [Verrucomicrobiota bacterium]